MIEWLFILGGVALLAGVAGSRSQEGPKKTVSMKERTSSQALVEISRQSDGRYELVIGVTFFFDTAESEDGHYLVGASPGMDESGRMKSGEIVLVDVTSRAVMFRARITQPQNPHVATTGVVVVEDWKKGDTLASAIVCFDSDGEKKWAKHFRANISDSGISPSGSRAFAQTCNTPSSSASVHCIDVATGETIWKKKGEGSVRFQGEEIVM